jgi:hypothetical protein
LATYQENSSEPIMAITMATAAPGVIHFHSASSRLGPQR